MIIEREHRAYIFSTIPPNQTGSDERPLENVGTREHDVRARGLVLSPRPIELSSFSWLRRARAYRGVSRGKFRAAAAFHRELFGERRAIECQYSGLACIFLKRRAGIPDPRV